MKALFFLLCPFLLGLQVDVQSPTLAASNLPTIQATVLSLTTDTALVEAQSGDHIRSGDQFTFPVGKLPAIGVKEGDFVRLTYTGFIQETWPAQIEVTSWQILTPAASTASLTDTAPPSLTINSAGQTVSASYSSATWTYTEGDGSAVTFCACGFGPLDSLGSCPSLARASDRWVGLAFSAPPDFVTIRYWPASLAGQTDATEQQAASLTWDGNGFSLPNDMEGLIVELVANWEQKSSADSFGSATYFVSFPPAG